MPYKFNSTDHIIVFFFAFIAIFACCRHVILPKELADQVPRTHLMTESEWRNLGVQQSPGWTHYLIHEPGKIFKVSNELIKSITVKNLLLFQRKAYSQIAVGLKFGQLIFRRRLQDFNKGCSRVLHKL